MAAIKEKADLILITVTLENRDELPMQILRLLGSAIRGARDNPEIPGPQATRRLTALDQYGRAHRIPACSR